MEFICNAITLLAHSCAHTYVTFAPGPAMRSFTPQAKPGAVRLHERKCSITVTFANSSATRSRCGNTDMLSWRSQWKISIGNSISSPRGTNRNVPDETSALCNAANLAEPSFASVRHEIFPEEIGVLDHGALERLKNHAALFQVIRNDVALDQLIVRENHPTRVLRRDRGNTSEYCCGRLQKAADWI